MYTAAAPTLACTLIAAFTYTGTVYIGGTALVIPLSCSGLVGNSAAPGASDLTFTTMFPLVATRDITTMNPYKTSVSTTVVSGLPGKVNSFTTRATAVSTLLS